MFIKLDLCGAYNLICIKEGEEEKTIFRCYYRYYKYTIMLFGLTNILVLYIRIINAVLGK